MNRVVLAALAVAVVACGKSKQDCKRQVDELMTLLRSIDHTAPMFLIDDDMHLVDRPELPRSDSVSAPVVTIKASSIEYQGQLVTDATALGEMLAKTFAQTQQDVDLGREPRSFHWDHRIYFLIDRDAKWGTIAAMADAAGEVGYVLHFVFAKPVKVQRPPRAPIDDELDRIIHAQDGNVAVKLAKVTSNEVHSCPAMVKVFGSIAGEEGGDKAGEMIEGIGPALVDCNCDVDMPNFRATMYRMLVNEHPTTERVVRVSHDSPPLELPATTPWHEAAGKLVAAAWLVAK